MEQFAVNRYVLKFSWFFFCIWVLSMCMIIVFLAMESPLTGHYVYYDKSDIIAEEVKVF